MIRKMSDEHKINFLEKEDKSNIIENIPEDNVKTLKQLSKEQKSKKLSNKDDGLMTNHHIRSSQSGVISDNGGPNKFIKSETSNTIFDTDKSLKLSKEIDSKTRVKEEKEQIATNKRNAEQKRMDEMVDSLNKTEQSKDSTIFSMGHLKGSKYYDTKNGISMFDTEEFRRLEEKTAGEKIVEENKRKESQIDESWKTNGKSISSKDFVNRFFDNLLTDSDK